MKLSILFVALMSLLIACLDAHAKGSSLSEEQANVFKDRCKELVKRYYSDLSVLMGENMDPDERNDIVDSVQYDCFRSAGVLIDNDIPAISQDNLNVMNYLKSIAVLSDKIDKITFNDDIVFSDIYYNDVEHYYYLVASIKQQVFVKDKKEIEKRIDIYLNFDPASKLKPKIYSIQNHSEGVLNEKNLVQILQDSGDNKADLNKPYFLFNVIPVNADIAIDGNNVFNDGSKIGTTPGSHTIEIFAANYKPMQFAAVAGDTGLQHIVRVLTPQQGYLAINSTDNSLAESAVYIDSNMVGDIPIIKYQLNVGPHTIEIKGGNNFFKYYHVTITDENTTTLNIQTNSDAKWAEKRSISDFAVPADASFQTFYDQLSPYGQWVEDPQYGNVWVPNVNSDFRPYYTNGHWLMTDYGNTWTSDEPWGWACYHYGRWTYNAYYNWVWVPGYQWAPAWVSWRFSNDMCGWAPLSPDLSAGVSNGCPDSWWVFVAPGDLYNQGYASYRKGPENNQAFIKQTTLVNNIYMDNTTHVRYNYGPSVSVMENATHSQIKTYSVQQASDLRGAIVSNGTLRIYKANLYSPPHDLEHPFYIVQTAYPIAKPQEITNVNRQSDFRQAMQTNKLIQQPYYRPGQYVNLNTQQTVNSVRLSNVNIPQQVNKPRPVVNPIPQQIPNIVQRTFIKPQQKVPNQKKPLFSLPIKQLLKVQPKSKKTGA